LLFSEAQEIRMIVQRDLISALYHHKKCTTIPHMKVDPSVWGPLSCKGLLCWCYKSNIFLIQQSGGHIIKYVSPRTSPLTNNEGKKHSIKRRVLNHSDRDELFCFSKTNSDLRIGVSLRWNLNLTLWAWLYLSL
jgi:hypothetical protein